MERDAIVYFLGNCVESSGHIVVVKASKGQVQLFNIKKKKPWCTHLFSKSEIKEYLQSKGGDQSLCPLCNKLKNRMGWRSAEGRIANTSTEPPDYIKKAITKHYSDKSIPKILYIDNSDIYNADEGIFTEEMLPVGVIIGRYAGTIYYDSSISQKSDKVMQIFIWGQQSVFIDATNAWPGKMNHKWDWPYSGEDGNSLIFQEPDFTEYFSNAFVSLNGEIVVKTPYHRDIMKDKRGNVIGIDEAEEVTIDYGREYWEDSKIKPFWDLRGAPETLITMILYNTSGRELLYDKGVASTLVLSEDWKVEVDENVFSVVYT